MRSVYARRLETLVAALADCICVGLATDGAGPTCFCGFVAGEAPAWDFCGECEGDKCGMGYITVTSVFPFTTFPNPAEDATCGWEMAATLKVGALRCHPTMGENGELPDVEEMAEAFLSVAADMGALLTAIQCCDAIKEHRIGEWSPLGPGGGCAGGEWTLTVAL